MAVRRSAAVMTAGVLALGVVLPTLPAAAAAPAVTVPGGLKVVRAGADSTDLAISWRPVAGADHVTVSIFDGRRDEARVLPGDATSLTYDGTGTCTRYRVRVSAVAADGTVATTNDYLVASLAPGGPGRLTASRTESGTAGEIGWQAPATGTATGYEVRVQNMGTGATVLQKTTTDRSVSLSGLDPRRQYSAKVTPVNGFGSCITGTSVLYGASPSQPRAFVVTRDAATPARVTLSWQAPEWSGYGPVTGYQIGYGDARVTEWVNVPGTSHSLNLDPEVAHVFLVRAISSDDRGNLSQSVKLARLGAPGSTVVDPQVSVTELDGTVTVDVVGPVGSNAAYPKMKVRIEPTLRSGTFRDQHVFANGAASVVFSQIPCGVYTVTVTGFGGAAEKEFGRQVVNRCDTGAVTSGKWRLVFGRADINGNSVSIPATNESRVMSTAALTSSDMVLTTTAQLLSGPGYGVWARARVGAGGSVSGYSFQYDPGYAALNPSFGPALVLRLWSDGRECGTPLARVKFPAGIAVNSPHRVMVAVKGDTLYATIDNKLVFNVESLRDAVDRSGCAMPLPTGTEVGFRTWSQTTAKFTGTTLS